MNGHHRSKPVARPRALILPLLLIASAALLGACRAPLPGDPCSGDSDCPEGTSCDEDYGVCFAAPVVDAGSLDSTSADQPRTDSAHDAAAADTLAADTLQGDAAVADVAVADVAVADVRGADLSASDSAAPDLAASDSAAPDLGATDSLQPDIGSAPDSSTTTDSSTIPDAAVADTSPIEATVPESGGGPDLVAVPDATAVDSLSLDTSLPDTSLPDTLLPDAGIFCEDGVLNGDTCYVHPAATGVNWREAFAYCQERGMHLLSIEELSEATWVLANLGPFLRNYIWLSATDMTSEDSFVDHNGAAISYENWTGAEPTDSTPAGDGEDCAVMSTSNGVWWDHSCRSLTASSDIVCERHISDSPPICGDGTQDPGEACDDGNTEDGDQCSAVCKVSCPNGITDNLSCYQIGNQRVDWLSSGSVCLGLELGFVAINSQEEMNFIITFRDTYASSGVQRLWLGYNNLLGTGWYWHNGDTTTYENWADLEPSSAGVCALLQSYNVSTTGQWEAGDCDNTGFFPLCESR